MTNLLRMNEVKGVIVSLESVMALGGDFDREANIDLFSYDQVKLEASMDANKYHMLIQPVSVVGFADRLDLEPAIYRQIFDLSVSHRNLNLLEDLTHGKDANKGLLRELANNHISLEDGTSIHVNAVYENTERVKEKQLDFYETAFILSLTLN